MTKYCFIGNVYPNSYNEHYAKCGNKDFSSVVFNNIIVEEALKEIKNLDILSCPHVGRYPFSTKTRKLSKVIISPNYICLGHSNFAYFDVFSSANAIYKQFKKIYNVHDSVNIIVSEASTAFLMALTKIKKHYHNVKSILIVLDLPENVREINSGLVYNFLKNKSVKKIKRMYSMFDAFIYLSGEMDKKVNLLNKPYAIFPCVVDFSMYDGIKKEKENNAFKVITYAGNLDIKYNIDFLIDAFVSLDNPNCRLQIIGDGNYKSNILELTKKYDRIQYLGLLTPKDALFYQKNSSVLVNPRLPNANYANESFPSKTIGYLLSYNPVVSFVFNSMPDDIASLIIKPENYDVKSLAKAINMALNYKVDNKKVDNVLKNYTGKRLVETILKIFEEECHR